MLIIQYKVWHLVQTFNDFRLNQMAKNIHFNLDIKTNDIWLNLDLSPLTLQILDPVHQAKRLEHMFLRNLIKCLESAA